MENLVVVVGGNFGGIGGWQMKKADATASLGRRWYYFAFLQRFIHDYVFNILWKAILLVL